MGDGHPCPYRNPVEGEPWWGSQKDVQRSNVIHSVSSSAPVLPLKVNDRNVHTGRLTHICIYPVEWEMMVSWVLVVQDTCTHAACMGLWELSYCPSCKPYLTSESSDCSLRRNGGIHSPCWMLIIGRYNRFSNKHWQTLAGVAALPLS